MHPKYRASSNLPFVRVLLDKFLHQLFALGVLKVDDLNALLVQVLLRALDGVVLPLHDPFDLVQDACARAHIAW